MPSAGAKNRASRNDETKGGKQMVVGTIILWIISLFILYIVIFAAVKDGIDKSEVGQLLIKKYGVKEKIAPPTDEEIEKELEDDFKNRK